MHRHTEKKTTNVANPTEGGLNNTGTERSISCKTQNEKESENRQQTAGSTTMETRGKWETKHV